QGGGLWVDAPTTITNVTFDGNIANDPTITQPDNWRRGNGGALAVASDAPVGISHATFARNQAGFNGGAIAAGASVSVGNSLFEDNTGANPWGIQQHCTSQLTAVAVNMQHPPRNPSPNFPNETSCAANIRSTDPQLGPLADNGGPTQTIALPAGSPALNAGTSAACAGRDQRNYRRTGPCDLGAFERDGQLLAPSSIVYLPLARR
ncbi:MAG TPA: choice-of-anchor Q domain-containing protein, partial [Herpetosiphonaceae bacterium]